MKKILLAVLLISLFLSACGKSNEAAPAETKTYKGAWSDGYVVATIDDSTVDIVLNAGGFVGHLTFSITIKTDGRLAGTTTVATGYYTTQGVNVGDTIYLGYSYNSSTDILSMEYATGNYPDPAAYGNYSRQ